MNIKLHFQKIIKKIIDAAKAKKIFLKHVTFWLNFFIKKTKLKFKQLRAGVIWESENYILCRSQILAKRGTDLSFVVEANIKAL